MIHVIDNNKMSECHGSIYLRDSHNKRRRVSPVVIRLGLRAVLSGDACVLRIEFYSGCIPSIMICKFAVGSRQFQSIFVTIYNRHWNFGQ